MAAFNLPACVKICVGAPRGIIIDRRLKNAQSGGGASSFPVFFMPGVVLV
jgi:hypothetical protein